jgi:branched-chain amino acid transport system substrate-binding protein
MHIVYDTTLYNTERATADAAYAIQLGFNIVGTDSYTSPATDLTPILTKVKASNPDILCQLGYLQDNLVFMRQVKEMNINPKVLFVSVGAQLPAFIEGLGSNAEQIWGQSCYERSWGQYANSDYEGLWQAADHFGYEANSFTASTFEAFMTLADAIERAGSLDRVQIRDALAATNMTGVMGPLSFDPVYQWRIPSPWSAFQIQNGSRAAIWPQARANANATIPMIPWNERG